IGKRDVEARIFPRGHGVEIAAHEIHVAGDIEGGTLARALEHHVLQEMRHAGLRRRFVARATFHPYADGQAFERGGLFRDHHGAILENRAPEEFLLGHRLYSKVIASQVKTLGYINTFTRWRILLCLLSPDK